MNTNLETAEGEEMLREFAMYYMLKQYFNVPRLPFSEREGIKQVVVEYLKRRKYL